MAENDNKLVNLADFDSMQLSVSVFNSFGGAKLAEESAITLDKIEERKLTFGMPAGSCSLERNVTCEIHRVSNEGKTRELVFQGTGKVTIADAVDEGRMCVTVSMVQFDERGMRALAGMFNNRQAAILNFLARVRD